MRWLSVRAVLAATVVAPRLEAQVVRIESRIICPRCSIDVERVTELQPNHVSRLPAVIDIDGLGKVFTYDVADRSIKVFESSGQYQTAIGRFGGGPGEYRYVRNLAISTDGKLHVLDGELQRHTVFTSDGKVVRISQTPPLLGFPGMPALLLRDNRWVINAILTDTYGAGYALQVTDTSGKREHLLDNFTFEMSRQWKAWRILAESSAGGFWVVRPFEFSADLYDARLSRTVTMAREASWLTPLRSTALQPEDGLFDEPYTPRVIGMWQDASGIVWLHMTVPSTKWKARPRVRLPFESKALAAEYRERQFVDHIVEAIDLDRRGVLARLRVDGVLGRSFGRGFIVSMAEESLGPPRTTIWRVRLNNP